MKEVQTPENLGIKNRKIIIELLKNGPRSRADISREIKLSFPAVSSNVGFLIDNGYVCETGEGNNLIGRKSTLLAFNSSKGYVFGIDLGRFCVKLMVADLLGETVVSLSHAIGQDGEDLAELLGGFVNEALSQAGIGKSDVLAACIGIPGVVDGLTDSIMIAPFAAWNNACAVKELRGLFSCPLIIENSVRLGAMGEKWKGLGVGCSNIVYIDHGIGIGSALVIDGALHRGGDGVAGEIGYMVTSPDQLRTKYQEVGALEAKISGNTLDKAVGEGGFGSLKELFTAETPKAMAQRADVLDTIREHVGMMLISYVAVTNPEIVIISGGIGINVGKLLLADWEELLRLHVPIVPRLVCSRMGSEASVHGAVLCALMNIDDIYCAYILN